MANELDSLFRSYSYDPISGAVVLQRIGNPVSTSQGLMGTTESASAQMTMPGVNNMDQTKMVEQWLRANLAVTDNPDDSQYLVSIGDLTFKVPYETLLGTTEKLVTPNRDDADVENDERDIFSHLAHRKILTGVKVKAEDVQKNILENINKIITPKRAKIENNES